MNTATASVNNWDVAHKAATRVVNNARRGYLLSNEEAEDCIGELTVEFAVRSSAWGERHVRLRLNDVVARLRKGGLTGEADGVKLHNIEGRMPKGRGRGDTVVNGRENHRPALSEMLSSAISGADNEASIDALLALLEPHDAQLLVEYYGLYGGEPRTLDELADAYGVSHQSIHKRIVRSQKNLRERVKKAPESRSINTVLGSINGHRENSANAQVSDGPISGERWSEPRGIQADTREAPQTGRDRIRGVVGQREFQTETVSGQ